MKARRQSRILALQALYEVDLTGHSIATVLDRPPDEMPEELQPTGQTWTEDVAEFARSLLETTLTHTLRLDSIIKSIAPEWPVQQMAVIDRSILRLAVAEILFLDTPQKVAINEAVELAKRFGSDSSPRFVNGALGAFVTQLESGQLTPSA